MRILVFVVTALLASAAPAAALDWPEVINQLAAGKQQAVVCVGLLKSREKDTAALDGLKLDYGLARGKIEGVIAGLKEVVAEGGKPERLPSAQDSLAAAGSMLEQFCAAARKTAAPNTKGVWDEIAGKAIEPLIKAIADGIGGLWSWKRDSDALIRKTRESQLESAQWPDFADISPL
jgi:hypothetical protein